MPYKDENKQRDYQKNWVRKRRREYFSNKYCKSCGSNEILQIHHRDPEQKVSHSIWSWKKEKRDKELEKCDILCRKCHQSIHHPRTATHGTITMYKRYRCRCDDCRKANANYEHDRRAGAKSPAVQRFGSGNGAAMPPGPLEGASRA